MEFFSFEILYFKVQLIYKFLFLLLSKKFFLLSCSTSRCSSFRKTSELEFDQVDAFKFFRSFFDFCDYRYFECENRISRDEFLVSEQLTFRFDSRRRL